MVTKVCEIIEMIWKNRRKAFSMRRNKVGTNFVQNKRKHALVHAKSIIFVNTIKRAFYEQPIFAKNIRNHHL